LRQEVPVTVTKVAEVPNRDDVWAKVPAAIALAVAAATFAGSAGELVQIGRDAGMAQPWVLPVNLDGVALLAVMAIHERRRDVIAWVALVTTVAVSTWLQAGSAPAGLVGATVYAVPPIFGGIALVQWALGWPLPLPPLPLGPYRRRHLPTRLRVAIIERDGLICGLCGGDVERGDVHIDHIHPVALGGSDDPSNLQVAHATCNMAKGARV
jgi:hypothetical protein